MNFKKISISGFGNSAYALIALLNTDLKVYSRNLIKNKSVQIQSEYENSISSGHAEISGDYKYTFFDSDIVFVTNPGNAYEEIYNKIREVNKDCKIVFTPGQNGLSNFIPETDELVYALLPMPFNCRIIDEKNVVIRTIKENYVYAGKEDLEFETLLSKIFYWTKTIKYIGDLYYADFVPLNSVIHPARLINLFHNKEFVNSNEYFYEDMTTKDTDLMKEVSKEFMQIDDSKFFDIEYFLSYYVYEQNVDLLKLFTTYNGYKGFKLPVTEVEDKYYLDSSSRYLFEDIHNLKCCQRKLKENGIQTPVIEKCIDILENFKIKEINEKI